MTWFGWEVFATAIEKVAAVILVFTVIIVALVFVGVIGVDRENARIRRENGRGF